MRKFKEYVCDFVCLEGFRKTEKHLFQTLGNKISILTLQYVLKYEKEIKSIQ